MSRRLTIPALAVVATMTWPLVAIASHDVPRKATSMKVDLVRANAACTTPNAVHDQVVVFASACAPAVPLSGYTFGPDGRGKASLRMNSNGIDMRFALTDVLTDGNLPADGVTFHGRADLRLTDHGCSGHLSCTVETSVSIDVPCVQGRCFGMQTYPYIFLPVGLEGSAEVLRIDVIDDTGDRFATHGLLLE